MKFDLRFMYSRDIKLSKYEKKCDKMCRTLEQTQIKLEAYKIMRVSVLNEL
jgi:hypothetical protein